MVILAHGSPARAARWIEAPLKSKNLGCFFHPLGSSVRTAALATSLERGEFLFGVESLNIDSLNLVIVTQRRSPGASVEWRQLRLRCNREPAR
jgi:hypothetical protein